MSTTTIYHNPACSTSRQVLALIRAAGIEPVIVDYLTTPPPRDTIRALAHQAGLPLRALLRQKAAPFTLLGLDDPALTDDRVLDAMAAHPVLLERPIVTTPLGTRLRRPAETVLQLLPGQRSADDAPATGCGASTGDGPHGGLFLPPSLTLA